MHLTFTPFLSFSTQKSDVPVTLDGSIDPNCAAPNVGRPHLCLQRPSKSDVPRWFQVQMLSWIPTNLNKRWVWGSNGQKKSVHWSWFNPRVSDLIAAMCSLTIFDSLMQELLPKKQSISLPLLCRCFQLKFPIEPYSSKNTGTQAQANPAILWTG